MVRQDILGGLKSALARNQSLQQAMESFYNAGYSKEDIETAAKALQMEKTKKQHPVKKTNDKKNIFKKIIKKQKPIQKVSKYGDNQNSITKKFIIIILVLVLVVLIGALISIFLFKEKILEVLNSLF